MGCTYGVQLRDEGKLGAKVGREAGVNCNSFDEPYHSLLIVERKDCPVTEVTLHVCRCGSRCTTS